MRCYIDDGVIVLSVPGMPTTYEIACERANTPEKVLGWIMHLMDKRWVDRKLIKAFIQTTETLGVKVQWPS